MIASFILDSILFSLSFFRFTGSTASCNALHTEPPPDYLPENDTETNRDHSTKNDKQKRQSSPRENWHHDDSIVYNCRLTGRIIPVEVRKEQRHQKSFFDELHIATLMAAPSVGRRSCVEQRKAAALISQNRRWDI